MVRFVDPLMLFVICATRWDQAKQILYLKRELEVQRARLPRHIKTTSAERAILLRFGKPVGKAIEGLITLVHLSTFQRWVREEEKQANKPRRKRRTPEEIAALIVRIAREIGVGYGRIAGELRKLGIRRVCKSTVANILKDHGIQAAPLRPRSTWKEFIERHKDTLYACDFFTKEVWTPLGRSKFDILAMIHIGSRKVTILGITDHAGGAWMAQRARELAEFFKQQDLPPLMLMHDRDPRFTGRTFDGLLQRMGVPAQPLSPASPNLNAHMERWVQSIKTECLDHFIVFGEKHLRYLVDEYVDYYNTVRPHQGIGNETIPRLKLVTDEPLGEVVCETRLGGLLKHYRRAA